MHPKALLDESTRLIEKVFKFDHPADAVVARHFRENKALGPRERATLSDTVYAVLRERLKLEWLARSGQCVTRHLLEGGPCSRLVVQTL